MQKQPKEDDEVPIDKRWAKVVADRPKTSGKKDIKKKPDIFERPSSPIHNVKKAN